MACGRWHRNAAGIFMSKAKPIAIAKSNYRNNGFFARQEAFRHLAASMAWPDRSKHEGKWRARANEGVTLSQAGTCGNSPKCMRIEIERLYMAARHIAKCRWRSRHRQRNQWKSETRGLQAGIGC